MFRFILRRLLQMVLAFFGTTLIVYALMFAGQGDPIQALAGERPVTAAQRAYLTQKYHLDQTGVGGFFYRYLDYVKNLLQGDLGQSLTGRQIGDILQQAWPVTVRLALIALAVAIVFGVTAGVIAGIRRASIFDNSTLVLTLLVLGIPTIVLAPLAQYFLGVKWQLFPPTAGAQPSLYALLLPGIVLGSLSLATALRLTRTSVAENLRADYVRTARSKGLVKRRIVSVHVLRNSLIPVVTFLGVELGNLMSGAIITETVFQWHGMGEMLLASITHRDAYAVLAWLLVAAIAVIVFNLIADLLYAVLDPRIRYE